MKHLITIAFGCLCFFCFSCSSAITEIHDIRSALLYDFQSGQNDRRLRLAVYARLNEAAESGGFLQIRSPASDYVWTVEKPLFVQDAASGYTWIGSSDIVPPPEGFFPSGRYTLIYTDEAGKKTETGFDMEECKSFDGLDLGEYTEKRLGIFNESGILLGYRSEKTDMSAEETAEKYPGSFFTRIILISEDGLSAVLREPVFIEDGSVQNQGGVR
ncbi:hypothetical protein V1L52_00060 [Treponema sp. HNW]|uniref:hypothetical protein n=1 Tax=Treponema sp. HNW TaxID=3116654 RepID=UPI003D13CD98